MNQVLYGFTDLQDLFGSRTTTVATAVLNTAVDASVREHNRQMASLLSLFAQRIGDYQLNYRSVGTRRLQPIDEQGRARPTKSGAFYTVGFPIQSGGDAFGQTFKARAKMTVEEVHNELMAMLVGDMRWMRDHLLAALYANVAWVWPDDLHGNLTVQGLANADTVTYPLLSGGDTAATDTHYFAQAAAIADATDPYPILYSDLVEHPENDGPYIALIPTNLVAATEALTAFYPATRPELSAGTAAALIANLNVPVPGIVRGFHSSGLWIVEWATLPDNYIVAVAAGASSKPLGLREEPEPELQGFRRVADRDDFPWYESQYQRHAGFGGLNRVGAAVYRIGNAGYAIPANYTTPMP